MSKLSITAALLASAFLVSATQADAAQIRNAQGSNIVKSVGFKPDENQCIVYLSSDPIGDDGTSTYEVTASLLNLQGNAGHDGGTSANFYAGSLFFGQTEYTTEDSRREIIENIELNGCKLEKPRCTSILIPRVVDESLLNLGLSGQEINCN